MITCITDPTWIQEPGGRWELEAVLRPVSPASPRKIGSPIWGLKNQQVSTLKG